MSVIIAHRTQPISKQYTNVSCILTGVPADDDGGFCFRVCMSDGTTATFHSSEWDVDAIGGF